MFYLKLRARGINKNLSVNANKVQLETPIFPCILPSSLLFNKVYLHFKLMLFIVFWVLWTPSPYWGTRKEKYCRALVWFLDTAALVCEGIELLDLMAVCLKSKCVALVCSSLQMLFCSQFVIVTIEDRELR